MVYLKLFENINYLKILFENIVFQNHLMLPTCQELERSPPAQLLSAGMSQRTMVALSWAIGLRDVKSTANIGPE